MEGSPIIGIDLGTSKSVAYICEANGKMRKLTSCGDPELSSQDILIANKIHVNLSDPSLPLYYQERELHAIKRLMGKAFDEAISTIYHFDSFAFPVKNCYNEIFVELIEYSERFMRRPQEMTCLILRKIKHKAEEILQMDIERVVITIPACFNYSQRDATLEAAMLVGFKDVKLISDPVAVTLLYSFKHFEFESKYSLVYDFGGGSFDVAIIYRENDLNTQIITVDGDSNLGGRDFDDIIINYVCDCFYQKQGYQLLSNKIQARALLAKCEEAKISLSFLEETSLIIKTRMATIEITLSRKKFEEMCKCLIEKTIEITERCLKAAMLPKSFIDNVILMGGSSKIPKIQQHLSKLFKGKSLVHQFCHPLYGNAEGAALEGFKLFNKLGQPVEKYGIFDVLPFSIGIGDICEEMNFVFEKNVPVPNAALVALGTLSDRQESINLNVYQGENISVQLNHYMGQWKISGLTPAPLGTFMIIVRIDLNSNGLIFLSATETKQEQFKSLTCVHHVSSNDHHKINSEFLHIATYLEKTKIKHFTESMVQLWNYCDSVIFELDERKLRSRYPDTIRECEEIIKILKEHQESNEEKLEMMKIKIMETCGPLLTTLQISVNME